MASNTFDINLIVFKNCTSISTGDVPADWKLANVTPVFKKGKKCSLSNYRPVSVTVILCKVF